MRLLLPVLMGLSAPSLWALPQGGGKLGFGSSTAVVSPTFQENVFLGFQVALEQSIGKKAVHDLLVVQHNTDKSISGAATAAEKLVAQKTAFMVGFCNSHDALLAAPVARKAGLFTLFGSPSHTSLAEMGPMIYSTGASLSTLLDDLVFFMKEKFQGKKGIGVVNPYSVFSMNVERTLKPKIGAGSGVNLEMVRTTEALVFSDADLARLKKREFDYLYLTLYPEDLLGLLNQLVAAGVDLPTVSFGGPDPDVLRRFMALKKNPYYIGTTWMPGAPELKKLNAQFSKQYSKPVNFEIIIGYNLGTIVGDVLKRIDGPLTPENVSKAFQSNRCFKVLDRELCFGPNGGHAISNNMRFARFTQLGLDGGAAKP